MQIKILRLRTPCQPKNTHSAWFGILRHNQSGRICFFVILVYFLQKLFSKSHGIHCRRTHISEKTDLVAESVLCFIFERKRNRPIVHKKDLRVWPTGSVIFCSIQKIFTIVFFILLAFNYSNRMICFIGIANCQRIIWLNVALSCAAFGRIVVSTYFGPQFQRWCIRANSRNVRT